MTFWPKWDSLGLPVCRIIAAIQVSWRKRDLECILMSCCFFQRLSLVTLSAEGNANVVCICSYAFFPEEKRHIWHEQMFVGHREGTLAPICLSAGIPVAFRTDLGRTAFWASAVLWQWGEKKRICPLLAFRAWVCCFCTAEQTEQPLQRLLFTYYLIGGHSDGTVLCTKAHTANEEWVGTKNISDFQSYTKKAKDIKGRVNGAHFIDEICVSF